MRRISSMLPIVAFATFLPACDDPDSEGQLAALDEEAELQVAAERADDPATGDRSEAETDLTATPRPAAAGCQFKVIWPVAGVYEQPGSNNLKNKNAGDIVGHGYFCSTYWDGANEWQPVATASAEDGIGWMRRQALVQI